MIDQFKKQAGFTLLETLVAFSIFAVSLGVLLQIYSKGTQAASYGDQFAAATMIAQSKLASIIHLDGGDIGEYDGEENSKYYWAAKVEAYEDDYPDLELNHRIAKRRVEVKVFWDTPKKTHSVKLVSMKLVPTNAR